MDQWTEIFGAIGVKVGSAIGGFFGSLVSLRWVQGLTALQIGCAVAAGTGVASYGTPLLVHYVDPKMPDRLEYAVAFFIGMVGLAVVGNFVSALPGFMDTLKSGITAIFQRWGGK
jgi:hypothetical protein